MVRQACEQTEILVSVVMSMKALNQAVAREGYHAVGNLLEAASCQDCAMMIDKFPGLLQEYINGLTTFSSDKMVLHSILTTLVSLLEKYPPMCSPLNIYE